MDLATYISARQGLVALSFPFSLIFLAVASGLIVVSLCSFWPSSAKTKLTFDLKAGRQLCSSIALIALLAGFCILVWFHYQIYRSFVLVNPFDLQTAGRFIIPFWIETEKIYFWTLTLGVLVFIINRRQERFAIPANLALSFFLFLVVFYSNPFSAPLLGFHREISVYIQGLERADIYGQLELFRSLFGRMRFYYNTSYMWTHPPLLFISYAAFVLSFLACACMLFKQDDFFEQIAYAYTKFGYLCLTFGMLIGYPWAILAWGNEPWWWAPKINVSLVMWVLYSAYLHSRLYLKRRGMWRTTAVIGIISFLSLVFTYATTYLIPGVHSYG